MQNNIRIEKIEVLNLSVRSYNCLKRYGINTIEELRLLSDENLNNIRNINKKSIEEIISKLKNLNLYCANEEEVDEKIEVLNLSVRSYNCLKRYGINTIEELRLLSDENLKKIENLDELNVIEIQNALTTNSKTTENQENDIDIDSELDRLRKFKKKFDMLIKSNKKETMQNTQLFLYYNNLVEEKNKTK